MPVFTKRFMCTCIHCSGMWDPGGGYPHVQQGSKTSTLPSQSCLSRGVRECRIKRSSAVGHRGPICFCLFCRKALKRTFFFCVGQRKGLKLCFSSMLRFTLQALRSLTSYPVGKSGYWARSFCVRLTFCHWERYVRKYRVSSDT